MNKTRFNWVYQRTYVHSSVATKATMQSRHRSTSKTGRSRKQGHCQGVVPTQNDNGQQKLKNRTRIHKITCTILLQVHHSMSDLVQVPDYGGALKVF